MKNKIKLKFQSHIYHRILLDRFPHLVDHNFII